MCSAGAWPGDSDLMKRIPPCQAFHLQDTVLCSVWIFLAKWLSDNAKYANEKSIGQSLKHSQGSGRAQEAWRLVPTSVCTLGKELSLPRVQGAAAAHGWGLHHLDSAHSYWKRKTQQNQTCVPRWNMRQSYTKKGHFSWDNLEVYLPRAPNHSNSSPCIPSMDL